MANGVYIPQLPTDTPLSAEDYLIIDNGSTTSKIPVSSAYASADAPGLVSTGAQVFAGRKSLYNPRVLGSSGGIGIDFLIEQAKYGSVAFTPGSGNPYAYIQEMSIDSGGNLLSTYELYKLPTVDKNRTSSAEYEILTTKNINNLRKTLGISYVAGNTITASQLPLAGLITSGGALARFGLATGKSLENISTITVTRLQGGIRTASGGYLDGSASDTNWLTWSGITVTAWKSGNNYIVIDISKSSAFTGASNNTPLGFSATLTLTLS